MGNGDHGLRGLREIPGLLYMHVRNFEILHKIMSHFRGLAFLAIVCTLVNMKANTDSVFTTP